MRKYNVYHGWRFQRSYKHGSSFNNMTQVEARSMREAAKIVLNGDVMPESFTARNRTFYRTEYPDKMCYVWLTKSVKT